MKIISRGDFPLRHVIRTSCRNCQSVFEFEPKEAERIEDNRDGDFYSIRCPVCDNIVTKSVHP